MIQKIFVVHDTKAEAYLPPFFMGQLGQATRVFSDCVNSKDHQFGKHPADYNLFHMGSFDDNSAEFQITPPKILGNGLEFVTLRTPQDDLFNENRDESAIQPNPEGGNSA